MPGYTDFNYKDLYFISERVTNWLTDNGYHALLGNSIFEYREIFPDGSVLAFTKSNERFDSPNYGRIGAPELIVKISNTFIVEIGGTATTEIKALVKGQVLSYLIDERFVRAV